MTAFSFDAAFREAKKRGAEFVLYDETYMLPASLPVGAILEVQRMERLSKDEQNEEKANVVELFDRVYGASKRLNAPDDWAPKPGHTDIHREYHAGTVVQRWLDFGLTVDQMVEMLQWAFKQYGGAKKDPTPAPKRGKA